MFKGMQGLRQHRSPQRVFMVLVRPWCRVSRAQPHHYNEGKQEEVTRESEHTGPVGEHAGTPFPTGKPRCDRLAGLLLQHGHLGTGGCNNHLP